ncbi:hypothetical protein QYM36_003506 [Artemia franciscana]|uniref:Uncharacterized protein n=1 Tax=Artemia franciscana TaxID=6661 RepID=A0AA88II51_ARTSF|nr:hypothetical protein QYM36_003506 [Artemia franciscana]
MPCFAKPRSSLDVPKELLIDSVPPSEIVIGGGRACEVSVGHFGGQKVALKKYIGIRGNAEYESVILKEAAAIYKTRHENVVGIRFVCLKEMTLGLECCEKVLTDEDGNPHSFNNARQILGFLSVLSSEVSREITPVLFSSMACQVSEGLRYLHSIKIIHADLKSANVLVTEKRGHDDSWLFKLADFGESRLSLVTSVVTSTTQDQSQQNRGGTICFMSPERCDGKRPTFACDLFSFGMFLYELHDFTIKFPFEKDGFPVDVIVNKIRSGVLPCHEDMSSPLKEVFLKCCAFEPKARPTVFELCKMLTELAPEAFMQPDRALNSTIQFSILNSNNDSYQENFSVSDLPLTDLSQPVSHSEFSSSGLPDSHLLVSEVMVPATEPSQMILDAVAGCALQNFGITQLKDFQIRSITNILKKRCFSCITLLVVPTIPLRGDQSDFLLLRGIDSFVVGEKIAPIKYDQQVTAISDLSENKPVNLVGLEGSVDWVESWSEAAKRIIGTVNGQLAIVYFSYAWEANAACSAISSLGVKAAAFTGECSSLDKNHIHAAMRNGEIEILCATTAYGCGLNLPDVRCVVRFGLPRNMSSLMQEQGRAGRDGKPARAVILLNEKYDINRCVFWLDGSSDGDKKSMLTNFVDVLKYAYSGFSGLCLRKFQVEYFGESLPQGDAQNCCQSCDDQSFQDASGEIRKVTISMNKVRTHDPGEGIDNDEPLLSGSGDVSKECSESELESWAQVLDAWKENSNVLPKQLHSLIKGGIPEALRGEIWLRLVGCFDQSELMDSYRILITKDIFKECSAEEVILRDLHRTFPAHDYFKENGGHGQDALAKIVKAYSIYDEEIGYCQGITFIAAALLLHMPEEQAFCILVKIMSEYGLRDLFKDGLEALHLRFYQLDKLLEDIFVKGGLPKVREVLGRSDWSLLNQFTTFGDKFSEWYSKMNDILRETCIRKAAQKRYKTPKALDNMEFNLVY